MSSEGVEPYIGGDVECKACGASPDFELTAKGKLAMMGELMKVKLCNDEKKSYEGPLVIATFMLYDGRVVSPQQALQHYRSKIKQNPKDLSGWLSLANLFDNLQKHKQAFSHYQECLKLDPICPEAAVNVAIYLDMKKNLPGEAWETLTACLNHHQQWKFYRLTQTTEREFVDELLGCYAELCERLSLPNEYADLSTARFSNRLHSATIQRLAPRAQPHSASKEKVGRNQPCPCGSGRKYKKCCMP
jgi:tetratricopeptide (TPR) repeat protein